MNDNTMQIKLKIDKEFKTLIPPLSPKEYEQLEANIIADGCREPIVIWNGYIIDGHNRYEICKKHHIGYKVKEMSFESRDEAVVWICTNQLGRRNIAEETRKYLIGIQYETEKVINKKKNAMGRNQYSSGASQDTTEHPLNTGVRTAQRIADENHISSGTVQKYGIYAKSLDIIEEKCPDLVSKILSGKYKISHESVCELAKKTSDELKKISRKMNRNQMPYIKYCNSRSVIKNSKAEEFLPNSSTASIGSIKKMPVYDPDSEITRLTLTIPSWISSIQKTRSSIKINEASESAKDKLMQSLLDLENEEDKLLNLLIGEEE